MSSTSTPREHPQGTSALRHRGPEPGRAPDRMRACVIRAVGGLDQVEVADVPAPLGGISLGAREVRVRVRAAALNRLDLFVIQGLPVDYHFPHVLGSDGAGVVDAVGPEVTAVRPGDAVMINPGVACHGCACCAAGEHSLCPQYQVLGEHRPGTMAEYVVVPETNVAPIPPLDPPLSWAEAAAFSLVTLTAWRMVVTRARVQTGEWVLVWGIGGGVSLTALRIAKLLGARVIATSSSAAKLEQARQLAADVTLNHAAQHITAQVRALTEGRGVDVVVENAGAATWEQSLKCLKRGGRLVTCGATTGPIVTLDLRRLFWHQHAILGSTLGNAAEYRDALRALAAGRLRPLVDRVYPLDDARPALERLATGQQLGKVVVEI